MGLNDRIPLSADIHIYETPVVAHRNVNTKIDKNMLDNMKQSIDKSIIWNEAAKSGLVLGLYTSAFTLISSLTARLALSGIGGIILIQALNAILWMAKFGGCLWLMRLFMKKLVFKYEGVTRSSTFHLGVQTALFSAIIVAGVGLLNFTLISPDVMKEAIDSALQGYSAVAPIGDSERASIERMMGNLPMISFFVTFTYCFLYGTVVSKIFSSGIPPEDIFSDNAE